MLLILRHELTLDQVLQCALSQTVRSRNHDEVATGSSRIGPRCRAACSHGSWSRPVPASSAATVGSIQCLALGFLIEGEHHPFLRLLRRVHVQSHEIDDLVLETRIVRRRGRQLRLEPVIAPHPGHGVLADTDPLGQAAGAPMRRGPSGGLLPGDPHELSHRAGRQPRPPTADHRRSCPRQTVFYIRDPPGASVRKPVRPVVSYPTTPDVPVRPRRLR